MRQLFMLQPAGYARGDIGRGLMCYEGVQGFGDPFLTLWRFRIYGGLLMADVAASDEVVSDLWVTTTAADGPNFFNLDE